MRRLISRISWPGRGIVIRCLSVLLAVIIGALVFTNSTPLPPQTVEGKARLYTRDIEFDFVAWTMDALRLKLFEGALTAPGYMDYQQQRMAVVHYIELMTAIFRKERDLRQIYADPAIADKETASAGLRQELTRLKDERDQRSILAEAVLQDQINRVAGEFGLTVGGQAIPPVLFHTTPLPMLLIISPREVIREDGSVNLAPDLPLEQQVALEDNVAKALNVSTLVEDIGGVGTYPTMVQETNSIEWLPEVVSHEWIHNYLTLRPLGMRVLQDSELRIMNETTASIAGKELGHRLLEIYYPELLPPPPDPNAKPAPKPAGPDLPAEPVFDFNKEMHITRVKVDEMLKAGQIDEAEAYMEARRKIFWEHGYTGLRKLNQAYFAFHGNYADQPMSAAGEDPVGAAVRQLRAQSPSLAVFLQTISQMTSFAELQAAVKGPTP